MKQIINKLNNFIYKHSLSGNIFIIYLFIPILLSSIKSLTVENDIWFLLNHGKYVLNHGFPVIEPFTIHEGFSFVMQQWLSSVIFYVSYACLGKAGLWICLEITVCFIMYFLYKLCMKLSENRIFLSVLITVLTTILMMILITTRPHIFTYLNIIITLYIMELYHDNQATKSIYFLPIISLLQINLHASMWFMVYIFMLPYIVSLLYYQIRERKNMHIYRIFLIIMIMFLVGFVNPYGINAIKYIFNSYGNQYINDIVFEMNPVSLKGNLFSIVYRYNLFIFCVVGCILSCYMFYKKGKIQLRHALLLYGVIFLALSHIRNYGLLVIGAIPFLSMYIKDSFKKISINKSFNKSKLAFVTVIILFFSLFLIFNICNCNFNSPLEKGVNKIIKSNNAKNATVYTNYNNGSYVEYRGLRPYIDTRAEVFLKRNNHKEDIFKEYYLLSYGYIKYSDFVNKYKFTHMIIMKNESIYKDALKDKNYKTIYKDKFYRVFERIKIE